jgi:hypothetical protein
LFWQLSLSLSHHHPPLQQERARERERKRREREKREKPKYVHGKDDSKKHTWTCKKDFRSAHDIR